MSVREQLLHDVHTFCVNARSREIYLHSYYGNDEEEPGVEYRQATTFIKNLHLLDRPRHQPILVHLHSIGGCWDNGMAMFDAVSFSKSFVTMLAYSQASSMSGILLQSAHLRVMMPNCHFLMHHGSSGGATLHPIALKSEGDRQAKLCDRMLDIFAQRAIVGEFFRKRKSSTTATVRSFFARKLKDHIDWFLDADEAVHYGLADHILGDAKYPTLESLRA